MNYSRLLQRAFAQAMHGWVCVVLFGPALLAGCTAPDDEQQIREAIDAMARAIEARDRSAFDSYLAPGFRAQQDGRGIDPEPLWYLHLRRQGQGATAPRVVVTRADVRVRGEVADVVLEVVLARGPAPLASHRGQSWLVESRWRRDGRWQVLRANWRRAPH